MICSNCSRSSSEGREYFISDPSTGYREEGFICWECDRTEMLGCGLIPEAARLLGWDVDEHEVIELKEAA